MSNYFTKNFTRIIKLLAFLFLEVLIFFIITQKVGGINLPNFESALIVVTLLSIVNALLWPLISYISLRFIVFTLGFGTFLIDGLILYLISLFLPGVSIEGISLFSIPLLLGLINSVISLIMDIDEDFMYYRYVLKRQIQPPELIDKKGYVFLEIDGLAYDILIEALNSDKMPFLKKLLDDGSHKITKWYTDLSSQTSSSQAGILHGNNSNIVAFRWVEKENGNKIVSSNSLSDAVNIERTISDGNGLLSDKGASRSNLFSGDAEDYLLTYSKFRKLSDFYTKTWYYLYSSPYVIARILVLFMADMLLELFSRIVHVVNDVQPRINRSLYYFVARSGANVVMREATTFTLIGDIYAGNYNAMYATYMGYDEIAHHSGIRDNDSFQALKQIDTQIKRIHAAINDSKRKYDIIVLSDHGQSGGPTFKQKYGLTLNDLVSKYLPENITIHSILYSNEDHFGDNFSIKPLAKENKEKIDEKIDNTRGKLKQYKGKALNQKYIKEIMEKKEYLREKDPIIERLQNLSDKYDIGITFDSDELVKNETAQTIILASGNLGLIYFTDWSNRLTYEQIEDAFPGLLKGLSNHEGIGFIMVKSSILGTMVLSDDNVYYMDNDKYVGEEFLKKYGDNVINNLKRTDTFEHVPDILVNSIYNEEKDEVYAFEELIGSHGGVGGTQQEPFVLYPSDWELKEELVGSENVHKFFKSEMENRSDSD